MRVEGLAVPRPAGAFRRQGTRPGVPPGASSLTIRASTCRLSADRRKSGFLLQAGIDPTCPGGGSLSPMPASDGPAPAASTAQSLDRCVSLADIAALAETRIDRIA